MAKTIQFTFDGEDYELEFSRRTVKEMEGKGFSISAMQKMPMTYYPMLFAGAFKCHHSKMKENDINAIYNRLPDKEDLAEKLVSMYNGALDTLFDEPEEDEKKIQWKANF